MSAEPMNDPEFMKLSRIVAALTLEYPTVDDEWVGSPFSWIKLQPSRRVGKIGEQIVAQWCSEAGFNVARAPDSDADRVIAGLLTEIKFSTLWKGGFFKFQQIRDQRYEIVICLGLSPFDAHCWVIPKHVLIAQPEGVGPQHAGRQGTDTLWLQVRPTSIPAWLDEWGGSLSDARMSLTRLVAHQT